MGRAEPSAGFFLPLSKSQTRKVWDHRKPPRPGPSSTHTPPLWPCSLVLQHEAAGLHCSQGTLPWAAVSGCRVPSRTALRVWHCGAGTEGTAPKGSHQKPAATPASLPLLLCTTGAGIPRAEAARCELLEHRGQQPPAASFRTGGWRGSAERGGGEDKAEQGSFPTSCGVGHLQCYHPHLLLLSLGGTCSVTPSGGGKQRAEGGWLLLERLWWPLWAPGGCQGIAGCCLFLSTSLGKPGRSLETCVGGWAAGEGRGRVLPAWGAGLGAA